MSNIKNLKIFETGNLFGNMNTAASFYPEEYTPEQRKSIFLDHRIMAGVMYGFNGRKMYMADQNDKSGTYFEINQDYVEANPNGWSDIREDILIVTDKTPGVVIGHPVADCPVVMMSDDKLGVTAIGHCSAELVDKNMPIFVADALSNSHKSKDSDIKAYVSACAGNSWTYDKYPAWAKDEKVWKDCIVEDEFGLFHIDLKKAIRRQLEERNIENVIFSDVDTITDPNFYSNSAARSNPDKKGRNFAGAFYKDPELVKKMR